MFYQCQCVYSKSALVKLVHVMWQVYNIILTTKLLVITPYWSGCAKQKWIKPNRRDRITLNWEMCAPGKLLPLADVPGGPRSRVLWLASQDTAWGAQTKYSTLVYKKKNLQHNKNVISNVIPGGWQVKNMHIVKPYCILLCNSQWGNNGATNRNIKVLVKHIPVVCRQTRACRNKPSWTFNKSCIEGGKPLKQID